MLKFKNVGADVNAIRRADLGGPLVESGSELEVDGEVTEETDDAYIVGEGDNARAYPKAQWELIKPKASKKADDKDKE